MDNAIDVVDFQQRMEKAISQAKSFKNKSVFGIKIRLTGLTFKRTIENTPDLLNYQKQCEKNGIKLIFRKSRISAQGGKINYVADASW